MTGALALCAAFLSPPTAARAAPPRPRAVAVYGHRGARARRPENTLPAFEHAVRAGVDFLELDLRLTRDSVLVAAHDERLDPGLCLAPGGGRLTAPPPIAALTATELRAYDCGTLKNPRFPAQRPAPGAHVPTLAEVFAAVARLEKSRRRRVQFYIEAKTPLARTAGDPAPEALARLVVGELRRADAVARSVLQSFDYEVLAAARRLEPSLRIAALSRDFTEDLVKTAETLKADDVAAYRPLLSPARVAELHRRGVRVVAWTANDPAEWESLVRSRVDGIITDDPEALIGWLGTRP